jgi:hypothetical protein
VDERYRECVAGEIRRDIKFLVLVALAIRESDPGHWPPELPPDDEALWRMAIPLEPLGVR